MSKLTDVQRNFILAGLELLIASTRRAINSHQPDSPIQVAFRTQLTDVTRVRDDILGNLL